MPLLLRPPVVAPRPFPLATLHVARPFQPASRSRTAACRYGGERSRHTWTRPWRSWRSHNDQSVRNSAPSSIGCPRLKGALLRLKPDISRIIHRVTPFIGLRGPLASDPTARMLHVLLSTLAVWMAAAWVATIPFAPVSFSRTFNAAVLEASYASALVLLRLGHFRRASLAYLTGTWVWATLVSWSFGGIHSPGALLYVSLPPSAAWLLGSTAAGWAAGGCLLGALAFTVLEMTDASLPLRQATPLGIWAVIVRCPDQRHCPGGSCIISRLQKTLKELQRHQRHLESLVDQRTHEVVQARDKAESANRAKSAFLANISHELRTPLSVILACLELLSDSDPSPDQAEDIAAIRRSGAHLQGTDRRRA